MRCTIVAAIIAKALLSNSVSALSHYPYIVPSSALHRVNANGATTTSPSLSCSTPDPWPFKCGIIGNLTRLTQDDTPTPVDSLNDCRDLCITNHTCSAFGYDKLGSSCMVLVKSLKANGLSANANASTTYWHRNCFSCNTLATAAPNAVTNGNFTTGDLSNWNVGAPDIVPGADSGTTYGVVSLGNITSTFFAVIPSSSNLLYLSQSTATVANTTYDVSFSYMVTNSGLQQAIYVLSGTQDQTGGYEFFAAPDDFVAGLWAIGRGTYVATANSTFGFIMSSEGNQTFYIDNIVVTAEG